MFFAGFFGARRFDHPPRLPDGGGGAQIQLHAADIGFVRDGFRMQFQHDRKTKARGFLHRVIFRERDVRFDRRDAVSGQKFFGFKFRQDRAPGFAHFGNDFFRVLPVNLAAGELRWRGRRFIKRPQVVAISPHVIKRLRRAVGIFEGRNVRRVENVFARFDLADAHPARDDRLALDVRKRLELFGGRRRIRHRLRRENDQQTVRVWIFCRNVHGLRVNFRAGIADHVHRIVVAPRRRQNLIQRRHRLRRQIGELRAAADEHVRGEHAGAAGIGHNRQARTFRARLFGEHFGHVEQFGNGVHAQNADALECRLQHFIAAGERAGVRRGGFRGGLGAAGLDDDDRFRQRHFARGGQKRPRIANGFHVDDNAFRIRIVAEMINQIAPADIEHGAKRDERAKADIFLQAPIENRRAERAALA